MSSEGFCLETRGSPVLGSCFTRIFVPSLILIQLTRLFMLAPGSYVSFLYRIELQVMISPIFAFLSLEVGPLECSWKWINFIIWVSLPAAKSHPHHAKFFDISSLF